MTPSRETLAELDKVVRDKKFSDDLASSGIETVASATDIVILFIEKGRGMECPGYVLALESLYYQMREHGFVQPAESAEAGGEEG